ncbi:MAG: deoxyribonucleotide triphosphate pyrophosphatase [Bacteroides sp. SM1_62]|nr:MAG: deoxyribonucleotide triphosphate pyrophosphatase [Bacteroides sp. SM1_62]
MQELVFATHNEHKAREIQAILPNEYRILSLDDVKFQDPVPENENSLEGNASQKAWYIHHRLGKDCFADDTGLEVDCLNGAPGVYSARYAELTCDKKANEPASEANIRKLLAQMEGETNRQARFRTIIALILGGKEYIFEGMVKGVILMGRRGSGGFGYDPVFLPSGYTDTFAEMSLEQKNIISHRALAVSKLVRFLKNYRPG